MPWDHRGYYARVYRVGRRVARQYFGRGPAAEAAALEDEQRRAEQQKLRDQIRQDAQEWQELLASLNHLLARVDALSDAELLAAGYRQHERGEYRQWKRAALPE